MRYAQIDENSIVFAVSDLSSEISKDHPSYKYMIKVPETCPMYELLGSRFDGYNDDEIPVFVK